MNCDLFDFSGTPACDVDYGNVPFRSAFSTTREWPTPSYELRNTSRRRTLSDSTTAAGALRGHVAAVLSGSGLYGDNPDREIGRETDVDSYIGNLVAVFTVIDLHPEGSVWVNLADKRYKDGNADVHT